MSAIRVFVYGTLKSTMDQWDAFKPSDKLLGRCAIEGDYRMYDLAWFPAVAVDTNTKGKGKVYGEVWEIDEDTLDSLDIIEGHPGFYERRRVDTPFKKAWCYFMPLTEATNAGTPNELGCYLPTEDELQWISSQ